jgi:hypothetical protein
VEAKIYCLMTTMKQNILTSTGEKILTLNIAQDYGQNLMA